MVMIYQLMEGKDRRRIGGNLTLRLYSTSEFLFPQHRTGMSGVKMAEL